MDFPKKFPEVSTGDAEAHGPRTLEVDEEAVAAASLLIADSSIFLHDNALTLAYTTKKLWKSP